MEPAPSQVGKRWESFSIAVLVLIGVIVVAAGLALVQKQRATPEYRLKESENYAASGLFKQIGSNYPGAIADFDKAIELNPAGATNFYNRAQAKAAGADYAGAVLDFGRAIAIVPGDDEYYFSRGYAREDIGDLPGAAADYLKAFTLKPDSSQYCNDYAWIRFLQNDYDACITNADEAIRLSPKYGNAYGTRGWARYLKGDISGAIADCENSVRLNGPDTVGGDFDQGMVYFLNGAYARAIASWQATIRFSPPLRLELQPWIDKATKLSATNSATSK